MTPENNVELHLRTVAEMAVMRCLLTALCQQAKDPEALLADFSQRAEEVIHAEEVRTGSKDHRLESFVDLWRRSVADYPHISPPKPS